MQLLLHTAPKQQVGTWPCASSLRLGAMDRHAGRDQRAITPCCTSDGCSCSHLVILQDAILQHEEAVSPALAKIHILGEHPNHNLKGHGCV